jgi:hypothetical protein
VVPPCRQGWYRLTDRRPAKALLAERSGAAREDVRGAQVFLGRSTLAADEKGGNEIDADAGFGAGVGAGDRDGSGGEFFDGVFVAESCEAIAAGVDQGQRRSHRCRLLPVALLPHSYTRCRSSSYSSSYSRRATSMTEPHGEVR